MGNSKLITLMDGYKEIGEVEEICAFEVPNQDDKYMIYTKNEQDNSGNSIIYLGKIITKDDKQFIENISEGKEWNKLKEILKTISKYSLEGEKDV